MPLKVEYKSKRGNLLEIRVRIHLNEVTVYSDILSVACSAFNDGLKDIKTGNEKKTWMFYKAYLADDYKTFEVWHLNVAGDKKRLIAVVTKN